MSDNEQAFADALKAMFSAKKVTLSDSYSTVLSDVGIFKGPSFKVVCEDGEEIIITATPTKPRYELVQPYKIKNFVNSSTKKLRK